MAAVVGRDAPGQDAMLSLRDPDGPRSGGLTAFATSIKCAGVPPSSGEVPCHPRPTTIMSPTDQVAPLRSATWSGSRFRRKPGSRFTRNQHIARSSTRELCRGPASASDVHIDQPCPGDSLESDPDDDANRARLRESTGLVNARVGPVSADDQLISVVRG